MGQLGNLIIALFLLAASSCSSEVQIANYIDFNSPFKLYINTTDDKTGFTTSKEKLIKPNSEMFKMLINWCNENSDNWKSSPASYWGKISVTQAGFRLTYLEAGGVVIGFTDKSGDPKQYVKTVTRGNLNFLINESIMTQPR